MESSILGRILNDLLLLILFYVRVFGRMAEKFTFLDGCVWVLIIDVMKCWPIVVDMNDDARCCWCRPRPTELPTQLLVFQMNWWFGQYRIYIHSYDSIKIHVWIFVCVYLIFFAIIANKINHSLAAKNKLPKKNVVRRGDCVRVSRTRCFDGCPNDDRKHTETHDSVLDLRLL